MYILLDCMRAVMASMFAVMMWILMLLSQCTVVVRSRIYLRVALLILKLELVLALVLEIEDVLSEACNLCRFEKYC